MICSGIVVFSINLRKRDQSFMIISARLYPAKRLAHTIVSTSSLKSLPVWSATTLKSCLFSSFLRFDNKSSSWDSRADSRISSFQYVLFWEFVIEVISHMPGLDFHISRDTTPCSSETAFA